MTGFKELFDAALAMTPRQGGILFLGGTILLVLNLLDIWPFNLFEAVILTTAAVGLAFGAAMLIIAMIGFGNRKVLEWHEQRKEGAALLAAAQQLDQEAIDNLDTLTDLERRQLVWILRNGTQRINAIAQVDTLYLKKILERPKASAGVYVIAPCREADA